MKTAFLYAGQGSQYVGMGKDFYEAFPVFKEVYDSVDVGFDLKSVSFEGPEETLNQTRYTQPCMVAFAVGVTKILREKGLTPSMAAGLSLGEYSALHCAGVFDDQQVINLVAFRGAQMEAAAKGVKSKMAAVIGLDREIVEKCCKEAQEGFDLSKGELVAPTNYNCPGQIVISGTEAPVDKAIELLTAAGARRCLPLKVSGPFHTALMKPAGDALKERFASENFGEMSFPVVFNTLGAEKKPEDKIADLLELQVQKSIYIEDSIRYMAEQGVDTVVEIGPGSALSKFVKKTSPEITCYNIEKAEDIEKVVEALS